VVWYVDGLIRLMLLVVEVEAEGDFLVIIVEEGAIMISNIMRCLMTPYRHMRLE
jgi:hypothetical protein